MKRLHPDGEEYCHAKWILDAVEQWAQPSMWLVRETIMAVEGRIDGILLPTMFDAPVARKRKGGWTEKLGLLGVEVKASRADFLRGLREGQFDRYDKSLAGLYVATTRAVKTKEIPQGIGHLVCYEPPGPPAPGLVGGEVWTMGTGWRCVCRRHVTARDWEMDSDTMWRLIFFSVRKARNAEIEARQRARKTLALIGNIAERKVIGALQRALDGIEAAETT